MEKYVMFTASKGNRLRGLETAMLDEFRPPWWLRNRHLQTFLGARDDTDTVGVGTLVHRVPTVDGEAFALHEDSLAESGTEVNRPAILLMHGLAGNHRSGYLVRIVQVLVQAGVRVFRIDMRGCGVGESWAYKPPHAGLTSDVHDALKFIAERCGPSKMALAGFSLGGNLVLKFLGELGQGQYGSLQQQLGLQYAIAISPPIDLSLAADRMEQGTGRFYTAYFMRLLQQQLQRKLELWEVWREQAARLGQGVGLRTIRDFDDAYTAPLSGFSSAAEYYRSSSSKQFLDSIAVQCDLLVAKDDPIVPYTSFHGMQHGANWLKNAAGIFCASAHGGHLGFIEGSRLKDKSWQGDARSRKGLSQQRWMDRWVCGRILRGLELGDEAIQRHKYRAD
jgi:predicted alpha/beta-fold hydrolase